MSRKPRLIRRWPVELKEKSNKAIIRLILKPINEKSIRDVKMRLRAINLQRLRDDIRETPNIKLDTVKSKPIFLNMQCISDRDIRIVYNSDNIM